MPLAMKEPLNTAFKPASQRPNGGELSRLRSAWEGSRSGDGNRPLPLRFPHRPAYRAVSVISTRRLASLAVSPVSPIALAAAICSGAAPARISALRTA